MELIKQRRINDIVLLIKSKGIKFFEKLVFLYLTFENA